MTVYVTKPAVNLREELANLKKPTGIVGESILRADTAAEAVEQLNLEDHTFTTFTSTGIDDNATSTALTIDASSRVGIGTSSPTAELEITAATPEIRLRDNSGTENYAALTNVDGRFVIQSDDGNNIGSSTIEFQVDGSEAMRIDSSRNLLVGRTDVGFDAESIVLRERGEVYITSDGRAPLLVNRLTSDGDIVSFRKDGTSVGSIGSNGETYLYIGSGDTGIAFIDAGAPHSVRPWNTTTNAQFDNGLDFGSSSARWDNIYATNGTIQTSDANEKQDIDVLSDAEQRVAVAAKGLLRKFRWTDAVAEKGDDARIHFGIIAQDLQAAFAAEGLDAGRYGMFIHTTWTDEETGEERSRMGVRYSELLAFIVAAI